MSKFLKILENSDPQMQDNDDIKLLNALHSICEGLGYNCNLEGSSLTVTIPEEENENLEGVNAFGNTLKTIIQIPDQGIGKQLMSPAARKLQLTKRNVIDGVNRLAGMFLTNIKKMESDMVRKPSI